MRDSKRKSKRKDSSDIEEDSGPGSLEMELELISMKGKNANFVQAHKKLLEENADLKNEVLTLQAELVNMHAKYNNLDFILKNLKQNMKRCTPNLIDILNLFLQVADKRSDTRNMSDQISSGGFTPKAKAVTHTVKPHTVNGTVLNLVPTISLTRLNTSSSNELNEVSSSNRNEDYHNSLPSTSADGERHAENDSPTVDAAEVEEHSFVSKRNPSKNSVTSKPFLNGSLQVYEDDDDDDDDEMEGQDSDVSDQEEENLHRLSTIREESFNTSSSARKRTSLGEVRIYLSRLSAEDMQVRRSQNSTSFSSTAPNVNDTRVDIETTIIENSEISTGKTLRADIMVFSPHTNSTRMECNNSALNDFSPRDASKTLTASPMSDIQSSEVTPSTSLIEANNDLTSSNKIAWLPTPSLSAMGDIDNSTTKLDILKESEKNENTKESPPPDEPITPQRYSKSSGRSKTKSATKPQDESPKSSAAEQEEARASRSLARHRRNVSTRPLTPTIVLERLESIRPERSIASSINIQITADEGPDEIASSPVKRQTRSKKRKAIPKSPKKSVKAKIKKEKLSEEKSLENKIREIQIRLSNYMPEAMETSMCSPKAENGRPKRAARPTSLKDASLKGKLRRMF